MTEWVFNEESEDGKLLQTMLNDLIRNGKKSKHYLEKFQKKASDYPFNSKELNLIFNGDCLDEIAYQLMKYRSPRWLAAFRGICRATDERTLITNVVYRSGVGNSMPVFNGINNNKPLLTAAFIANMNSLVTDFCVREKVGGINLNFFIIMQFPVLSPEMYKTSDLKYIIPRVLELTYTSNSMRPWAEDVYNSAPEEVKEAILAFVRSRKDPLSLPIGCQLPQLLGGASSRTATQEAFSLTPFKYDPERRAHLRAELDAYYAKLYGLTRDELRYILDPADVMGPDYPSETFRVLKDSEIAKYGTYRTRDLVLAAYDNLCK